MITLNAAGILGFAALVLLALLIVKIAVQNSDDKVAKGLRLVLLIALGAMINNQFFAVAGLYDVFPHYSFSTIILMYSIGPLLYAVVQRLTSGRAPWQLPLWPWHCVLPLALTAVFIPYYWQSGATKAAFVQTDQARQLVAGLYIVNYFQIGIYLLLCRRPLRQFKQALLNQFSAIQQFNLTWVQLICWGLWCLIFLDIFLPLMGVTSNPLYYIFLLANSFFIVVVTYAALGRSPLQYPSGLEVFNPREQEDPPLTNAKYSRSGLREDSARYLVGKLEQVMADRQLFLQEDLSLSTLATSLNTQGHHLSQVLNEQLNKNFYDYVNELRVDYAKKLLLQDPTAAIVDVAIASGFNNKVTFYSAFRRYVGQTPSQFRRQSQLVPTP